MGGMIQTRSPFRPPAAPPSSPGGLPARPAPASDRVGKGLFAAREPVESVQVSAPPSGSVTAPPTQRVADTGLNTARAAAVAALPPGLGAAFAHVFDVLGSTREAQEQLLQLLDSQALTQKVADTTVVEHLSQLTEKPRAAGLDGAALTAQTVALLADPDHNVYQGINTYTCGAANVQRQLAETPAVLAELVDDLSRPEGVGRLATGVEVRRAEGSLEEDSSQRRLTDRLLQGALMGLGGSQRGAYLSPTDSFADGTGMGLKTSELAELTAQVQGCDQIALNYNGKTREMALDILSRVAPGQSFQFGMYWNKQNHMLLVTRMKEDQVDYFDPQTGQPGTMALNDFLYKSQFFLVPATLAEGHTLPPEEVHWGRYS